MKTIATALMMTSALCAQPAFAHIEIDNQCNMELHGSVTYSHGDLTITTESGEKVLITPAHQLYVDGQNVNLNNDEQRWVTDYYTSIESAIPMTVDIARDGIKIASYAVTEVFSELLGADHELTDDFDELFTDLSAQIEERFYAPDGTYQFNSADLEGNWADAAWSEQLDDKIDDLVERSMGHFLMAIGRQMLFADGDMEDFATRMENFGETIEQRVEGEADALESKADELCTVLAKADYAETHMQQNIAALKGLDLLETDGDSALKQ
ncbi:MAG: YggN family protein [Alteromonadaceae bacterium]|nr:YggN family protein [Alteromonadaceae bacterium]